MFFNQLSHIKQVTTSDLLLMMDEDVSIRPDHDGDEGDAGLTWVTTANCGILMGGLHSPGHY